MKLPGRTDNEIKNY
jgi:transcription factor MYB, plant